MKISNARSKTWGVPVTTDEDRRINDWAKRNGYLKGAMIRKIILSAVEQDEAIRAGKTQIDYDALQGR